MEIEKDKNVAVDNFVNLNVRGNNVCGISAGLPEDFVKNLEKVKYLVLFFIQNDFSP